MSHTQMTVDCNYDDDDTIKQKQNGVCENAAVGGKAIFICRRQC